MKLTTGQNGQRKLFNPKKFSVSFVISLFVLVNLVAYTNAKVIFY